MDGLGPREPIGVTGASARIYRARSTLDSISETIQAENFRHGGGRAAKFRLNEPITESRRRAICEQRDEAAVSQRVLSEEIRKPA